MAGAEFAVRFGGVGEPVGPVDVGGDGTLGKQLDEIGEILSEPVRVVRDDPSRDIVTISGNLTDDPRAEVHPSGALANFRMAVTARVRDGETWRNGDTSYFASTAGGSSPSTSPTSWPRATAP